MEEDFSQAVLTASRMAEDGDVVLLSPACASFDHFKNFAQRGQTFKAIVNGLMREVPMDIQASLEALCSCPAPLEGRTPWPAKRWNCYVP